MRGSCKPNSSLAALVSLLRLISRSVVVVWCKRRLESRHRNPRVALPHRVFVVDFCSLEMCDCEAPLAPLDSLVDDERWTITQFYLTIWAGDAAASGFGESRESTTLATRPKAKRVWKPKPDNPALVRSFYKTDGSDFHECTAGCEECSNVSIELLTLPAGSVASACPVCV